MKSEVTQVLGDEDYPKVTETEIQSEETAVSLLISSLVLQNVTGQGNVCTIAFWLAGPFLGCIWADTVMKFPRVLLPEWDLKNRNIPGAGKGGEPPVLQPVLGRPSDQVF